MLAGIADVAILLTILAWAAVGVVLWGVDRMRAASDDEDVEPAGPRERAQVRWVFLAGLGVLLVLELLLTPFDLWAAILLVPLAGGALYAWQDRHETTPTDDRAWTSTGV